MITLLDKWGSSRETSSSCPSLSKDVLGLVQKEHGHLNFSHSPTVPFLREETPFHLALSPWDLASPALDGLDKVDPSPPAASFGCSCSFPHCSEGKLIVKTVVKVLVNHSVLKNTSKNGFIINGPAVSTMKSRLSSEARIFLNETVLVQSSSIAIWKRSLSQIIRPNIEKSRQISKAKDTQEVGLGNLLFFSRFTQSY